LHTVYFQEESKASSWRPKIEELPPRSIEFIPSSVQPPKLDLKPLPLNLKSIFLGENETFSIIISSKLNVHQEGKLLQTLKMHKNALGWTITDIKGISSLICIHKIYLEENANLKYTFLGENETFPIIISSKLSAHLEGKLL
jgi:hypothetical protein